MLWTPLTTRNSYKKQQMVHSYGHHFTPQSTNTLQITANAHVDQNRGGGGPNTTPKSRNQSGARELQSRITSVAVIPAPSPPCRSRASSPRPAVPDQRRVAR